MIRTLLLFPLAWADKALEWLAPVPTIPRVTDDFAQPMGEYPDVPAAGVETPDSAGGGHLSLPDRMLAAAETMREVNALYDLRPNSAWRPDELLHEMRHVAFGYPNR